MGSHLYQPAEMKALSLAIRKTGRPMVLSISPGPRSGFGGGVLREVCADVAHLR